jgi:hypothetical protein
MRHERTNDLGHLCGQDPDHSSFILPFDQSVASRHSANASLTEHLRTSSSGGGHIDMPVHSRSTIRRVDRSHSSLRLPLVRRTRATIGEPIATPPVTLPTSSLFATKTIRLRITSGLHSPPRAQSLHSSIPQLHTDRLSHFFISITNQ